VIAKHLSLSGNTVRNHVAGIYGKIGVNRRAGLLLGSERGFASKQMQPCGRTSNGFNSNSRGPQVSRGSAKQRRTAIMPDTPYNDALMFSPRL
jgi:hypothetical protein